jgi:ABC-2 type transport system ATP-binding protein
LSKGNRQKLGLVQAFMHTPQLLILDEPTSGLDPIGQQIFLDMVAEAAGNGQTVFMSSHIMSEVEAVADRVGIIRDGRLAALNTVSGLRANAVRDVEVTFAEPVTVAEFAALPAVRDVQVDGTVLRCQVTGSPDALLRTLVTHRVTGLLVTEPALEDLFHGYYTGESDAA